MQNLQKSWWDMGNCWKKNPSKFARTLQNLPLFKSEKIQNTPLFKILPIPGLHCIKLGGVNLLFKHLGEAVKLENFQKIHSLIQEDFHGGHYVGPDCDKILSKLDDLEDEVKIQDPSTVPFVDALRDLKEVYRISHTKNVDPNHREIIKKLWELYDDPQKGL